MRFASKRRGGRAFRAVGFSAAAMVALGTSLIGVVPAAADAAAAGAASSYSWQSAKIGGGGFVDGIVFNQSEPNLIYASTDIGGMYRWNESTKSWTSLLDWVGFDNWGYNGVVSVASDPVQTNRVYAAVGMYTNSWDPNNGAILRSTNKGDTWSVTPLPFKLGGNMPGRGMGERLAIDPNNDAVLYFGAPSGKGLWRSTDYGATWSQVTSFPDAGTYIADPTDTSGYQSDLQGVVWEAFDNSSGTPGNTTQDIYVGVADPNNPVWRSTDGGATWAPVPGTPTGYIPHKGVFDQVNHLLYIATSNTGGPYDGSAGDVWKLNAVTGTWTNISPVPSTDSGAYYGYSGLTIDQQHPSTIMVASQISWWPDTYIYRSTDGGATWTSAWSYTHYPNTSDRFTIDASSEPWLTFGTTRPQAPERSPKLGWMDEAMEIDPFNSSRMMYGTGATLYGTTDLTDWDSGGTITIKPMVNGLEETAVKDLISPPSGAPLLSALGDVEGFRHTDLATVPNLMYTSPMWGSTTSLDFAELDPTVIVRAGNPNSGSGDMSAAFSTDDGASWTPVGSEPAGITDGGMIAEGADAGATVWSPGGAPVSHSTDSGRTWASSAGIPSGAVIASDRVNGQTFYAFSGGTFYRSTDGGATFTATPASGLPTEGNVHVKAVPGRQGDVWVAGGSTSANAYGLWHSTDGGNSFTQLANVDQADNIGFGMAAPGASYPALYAIAQVGGVRGIFRSDDEGSSWVRINDDQHQYGNIGDAITGDPRVYGRVYLGTNGRGIIYGDMSTGGADTTPPSAPTNVTVTGTTSSTVSLSWTASTDNVGVAGYDVYRNSALVGTTSSASFTDSGLAASTTYTYTVTAYDAAGNASAASSPVSATTAASGADTTPPSPPTNLTATSIGRTSVSLAWHASTDNVGVVGYYVYRDSALVGTSSTASYTDGTVSRATTYTYTVAAYDAAGNVSALSNTLTVTTPSHGNR